MQSTTQHIKNLYKLGSHTMIVVSVTTVVRCATMYTRTSTPLNIIVIKVVTYIYKREREHISQQQIRLNAHMHTNVKIQIKNKWHIFKPR